MIDPIGYLCGGENDVVLNYDAMCLMFSCVVNRLKGNSERHWADYVLANK